MKSYLMAIALWSVFMLQGCSEEQVSSPPQKAEEDRHSRFSKLDPKAWEGLPMKTVVSDFQTSDGIFSSFICDEINKRLSTDPSVSLEELNKIDTKSRTYAFKICFSPEGGDPSDAVLEAIRGLTGEYPDLVKEITDAAE